MQFFCPFLYKEMRKIHVILLFNFHNFFFQPGRVVTLLPAGDDDVVWGVAYKISEENKETVLDHLDFREKNGYVKDSVLFHPENNLVEQPFKLTIYVATEENISFAGTYTNDFSLSIRLVYLFSKIILLSSTL